MLSPRPAGHTVPDTACCAVWVCSESTLLTHTLLGKPVTPRSFFTGQLLGQSAPSPRGCLLLLLPRAELCTPVHHKAAVDPKPEFLRVVLYPQFAESMIILPGYI